MHATARAIMIAAALGAALTTPAALAEVEVEPIQLSENRSVQLKELDFTEQVGSDGSLMTLTLLLSGPEVAEATHYGQVDVTEVRDDTGASLAPPRRTFPAQAGFQELDREHMWFLADNPPEDKIKVDIRLEGTDRGARRLASIKGSLQLRTTATESFTVEPVAGQSVEHALLERAGATLEIRQINDQNGRVQLAATDPDGLLGDPEIVNADGEDITMGTASFGFNDRKTIQLDPQDQTLPEGAKIRVHVITGREDLQVPFEFEDLPLP